MTKVLMTGSSGFVAADILKNHRGIDIRCVSRKPVSAGCDQVLIDSIDSKTNWKSALSGVTCVLHLAAIAHQPKIVPDLLYEVNVNGAVNLASQALNAGVKRFVFVSSIGVIGSSSKVPFTEVTDKSPEAMYAQSKLEAEQKLKALCSGTDMDLVIVRPPLVYGPGAPGNFGLLNKLVFKLSVLPFGLAANKRSFISVGNLSDFLSLCTTHPKAANQDFVISDGCDVSIRQFTDAIALGLGKKIFQLPVPVSLMSFAARLLGRAKQADQLLGDLQVDCSKAKRLLGWRPPETMCQAMSKLNNE